MTYITGPFLPCGHSQEEATWRTESCDTCAEFVAKLESKADEARDEKEDRNG